MQSNHVVGLKCHYCATLSFNCILNQHPRHSCSTNWTKLFIVMILSNIQNEHCFSTYVTPQIQFEKNVNHKSKLGWNFFCIRVNYIMDNFPFEDVIKDWTNNIKRVHNFSSIFNLIAFSILVRKNWSIFTTTLVVEVTCFLWLL